MGVLLGICLILPQVVEAKEIVVKDVIDKMPNLRQGIAYSVPDGTFRPSTSVELIKKWGVSLEAGYIGEDVAAGFISYNLGALEKFAEVPILQYVDLSVSTYYGFERINKLKSGEDWGFSVRILEIDF